MRRDVDIAIVGAGPVGALLAIYLARRGLKPTLFERRSDIRKQAKAEGRSINLAISRRGIHALEQLGFSAAVLQEAVPMYGRLMHSVQGALTFQRYGVDDSQFINSISRAGLNRFLLERAEKDFKIPICFQHRLVQADFNAGRLTFRDEANGAEIAVQAGLTFGTDGSASAVRRAFENTPEFTLQEINPKTSYKELTILDDHGRHKMKTNCLHIWPRGKFLLIALPNFDGSFTCTLFLPSEGEISFASLATPEAIEAFFKTHFPDAVPLIDRLAQSFLENPTGGLSMIKCYPWTSPEKNAVLLGDAAHAIIPFFGQGMNCGFEDVVALDRLLGESKDGAVHWKHVLGAFEQERKPRADAIANLSTENFTEMRDRVGDTGFLLQKAVEHLLEEKFPGEYISRYGMVSFTRIPYDEAVRIGEIQKEMLNELCRGLQKPEQVDLERAGRLIRERLSHEIRRNKAWI